jgi:hypothetical protein
MRPAEPSHIKRERARHRAVAVKLRKRLRDVTLLAGFHGLGIRYCGTFGPWLYFGRWIVGSGLIRFLA